MNSNSTASPSCIGNQFEMGPIRPPSEAHSLLIRVTRNCHWNRCKFCPVYKGHSFSIRPVDAVKHDIDLIHKYSELILDRYNDPVSVPANEFMRLIDDIPPDELPAFDAALAWLSNGAKSVFLQDADALFTPVSQLSDILQHLMNRFPHIERVTTYARTSTILKNNIDDLIALRNAGLTRVHVGLESGSDRVLRMMRKGATKAMHVRAGLRVKQAGLELSEYVMPGLGGQELSIEHAVETADALNQIDPHFIRLRQLAIPERAPLFIDQTLGRFRGCTDLMIVQELRLFIESLEVSSTLLSDHILNILPELEGQLPADKNKMCALLDDFLRLSPYEQFLFQIGRRTAIMNSFSDLRDPSKRSKVTLICQRYGISPENANVVVQQLMQQFI